MAGPSSIERAADRGRRGIPHHTPRAVMRRRFLVLAGSGLIVPLVSIRPTHATPAQVAALIAAIGRRRRDPRCAGKA